MLAFATISGLSIDVFFPHDGRSRLFGGVCGGAEAFGPKSSTDCSSPPAVLVAVVNQLGWLPASARTHASHVGGGGCKMGQRSWQETTAKSGKKRYLVFASWTL